MAKLLDFRRDGEWYRFGFTATGDDFNEALAALKTMRLEDRRWDPETKTWSLRVGPGSEQLLAEAFENGKSCVEAVKAQLSLWPWEAGQ